MKSHPLKVERELHGWSQAKVAEAVGTNVRTVIRWEQGQSLPYPYYREQLCTLFGKNARELGLLVQEGDAASGQEKPRTRGLSPLPPQGCFLILPFRVRKEAPMVW
jgi:transcriptional regulator with XRE-family HTH domain